MRELAIEQANELDLLRLVWLEARIDARQGRVQKALTGLESVYAGSLPASACPTTPRSPRWIWPCSG